MDNERKLPEILLIGDSIRMGYCATVAADLADTAKVVYPEENCRNSQHVMTGIEGWAKLCASPAIVHVNFGQWDTARFAGSSESLTSPVEYGRNADLIFKALHRVFPGAEIVFATTTPMRPGPYEGPHPRFDSDIDLYNTIAVEAAGRNSVRIDDIHEFARGWPSDAFTDSCHYTPESFARIGHEVARFLRETLEKVIAK